MFLDYRGIGSEPSGMILVMFRAFYIATGSLIFRKGSFIRLCGRL